MSSKVYAVRVGRKPGIYKTWDECKRQTNGYSGAKFKSFQTMAEAEEYMGIGKQKNSEAVGDVFCYVDGSYEFNTYGSGAILHIRNFTFEIYANGKDAEMIGMRNVAGEVLASSLAVVYAHKFHEKSLDIFYDYEGIEAWATGAWTATKTGTKNYQDLIKKAKTEWGMSIRFHKVAAHTGVEGNEDADALAKCAIYQSAGSVKFHGASHEGVALSDEQIQKLLNEASKTQGREWEKAFDIKECKGEEFIPIRQQVNVPSFAEDDDLKLGKTKAETPVETNAFVVPSTPMIAKNRLHGITSLPGGDAIVPTLPVELADNEAIAVCMLFDQVGHMVGGKHVCFKKDKIQPAMIVPIVCGQLKNIRGASFATIVGYENFPDGIPVMFEIERED